MVGVDGFGEWMGSMSQRYPAVPRYDYTPESLTPIGFSPAWTEDIEVDVVDDAG